MRGLIIKGLWEQTGRPKVQLATGTQILYKRKVGENDDILKHKCCFVANGNRQKKGVHYQEARCLTSAAATIRSTLATVAIMGIEPRNVEFEQAFLLANRHRDLHRPVGGIPGVPGGRKEGQLPLGAIEQMPEHEAHRLPENAGVRAIVRRPLSIPQGCQWRGGADSGGACGRPPDRQQRTEGHEPFRGGAKIQNLGKAPFNTGCHIRRNREAKELKNRPTPPLGDDSRPFRDRQD